MRRTFEHGPALVHKGVTGADRRANLRHHQAALSRPLQDFAKRNLQVLLDVIAECLQRRDVQNFRPVLKVSGESLAN